MEDPPEEADHGVDESPVVEQGHQGGEEDHRGQHLRRQDKPDRRFAGRGGLSRRKRQRPEQEDGARRAAVERGNDDAVDENEDLAGTGQEK
jgi:hypothetical protein